VSCFCAKCQYPTDFVFPSFVSDIVHHTGLTPSSRFFDMGSGVGTVVLQAALQAGCTASGIEKMCHPARIATEQLEQFAKRCRMWGVEPGEAELLTGDFTDDDRVRDRIIDADVVLCNNWAFSEKRASILFSICSWNIVLMILLVWLMASESVVAQPLPRYERRCYRHLPSFLYPAQLPVI
jgi:tRNA A58 N-methylase Trm61